LNSDPLCPGDEGTFFADYDGPNPLGEFVGRVVRSKWFYGSVAVFALTVAAVDAANVDEWVLPDPAAIVEEIQDQADERSEAREAEQATNLQPGSDSADADEGSVELIEAATAGIVVVGGAAALLGTVISWAVIREKAKNIWR